MNNRVFIFVVAVLIFVAVVGFMSYLPARTDKALSVKVADFPATVGEWTSTDVPVGDDVYRILETRNLFVREYKNPQGGVLYLYVVYSEDNRKVSHPPEVCLLGSGVTIVDKARVPVTADIQGTRLLIEKEETREMVVYWFKAGTSYTDKYLKQQFKIVIDRLLGKRTAGAFIRLSTDVKDNDTAAALKMLKSFASQIEPLLAQYVP